MYTIDYIEPMYRDNGNKFNTFYNQTMNQILDLVNEEKPFRIDITCYKCGDLVMF